MSTVKMNTDSDAFDEILSQLTALGSEIDHELTQSSKYPKITSPESVSSLVNGGQGQQSNNGEMNYYQQMQHHHNYHNHHQVHPFHSYGGAVQNGQTQVGVSQNNNNMNNNNNSNNSSDNSTRTESPDNDSAFSDSISLISTEQSTSSSSSSSVSKSSSSRPSIVSSPPAPPNMLPLHHHTHNHHVVQAPSSQLSPHSHHDDRQSQASSMSESGSGTSFDHQFHTSYPEQKCELFFDHFATTNGSNSQPATPTKDSKKKIISENASVSEKNDDDFENAFDSLDRQFGIVIESIDKAQIKIDFIKNKQNNFKNSTETLKSEDIKNFKTLKNQEFDDKISIALKKIREANFRKVRKLEEYFPYFSSSLIKNSLILQFLLLCCSALFSFLCFFFSLFSFYHRHATPI